MCALTFGLVMACVEGYSHGMSLHVWFVLAAVAAVVAWRFVTDQLRKPMPILPFDLLRIPIFSLSIVTSICSFTAQMLAMVSLPFMLMHSFGYDAVGTGLLMTASPIAIAFVAPVAGMLIGRIHPGILGGIGITLMSLSAFSFAFIPDDISHFSIVWRMMLFGTGFGLFQSPNNHILLSSAPPHRTGSASRMLASARLIGQTTGAALVAMMFNLSDDRAAHDAMLLAAIITLFGAVLSLCRVGIRKNDV